MDKNVFFLKKKESFIANNHIKSFVLRNSRITKRQKYAINKFYNEFCIKYKHEFINLQKIFLNNNHVVLEIGFGNGESLTNMALFYPEINFLGIEVYLPGIGSCLYKTKKTNLKNLRIINYDAVDVLQYMIKDNTLYSIQLFFPDPWHKIKHNKRRIIQSSFVKLMESKLINNGIIYISTDCKLYAQHILNIMSQNIFFREATLFRNNLLIKYEKFLTKFKKRGEKLGHEIINLIFIKK